MDLLEQMQTSNCGESGGVRLISNRKSLVGDLARGHLYGHRAGLTKRCQK